MKRLHPDTLHALARDVAPPLGDRHALQPGIVHLGIGAFMRAHLAVATEHAMAATGERRWGIVGVSLRQANTRDTLAAQGGLYAVAQQDAKADGQPQRRVQVIGCLHSLLVAPEDPKAVLQAVAHPQARILSLSITEKGYLRDPARGSLQAEHPDVVHDLQNPRAPRTALGFIVHGLAIRREQGLPPLTLLSLDNLPSNGHSLRTVVAAFAQRVDPALAEWIDARCTFPNSMVDRIVPRTTDADRERVSAALGLHDGWPVVTEPFLDWAVEDRFAQERPRWDLAGVRFVQEAAPWETLKLRMVNGSHSAIAYLGVMAGWATVDAALAQEPLRSFVDALMREEVAPTLPALKGLDLALYRQQLLQRFANPALAHRTLQIAMDGSQKLPQRLLGTMGERLQQGQPVQGLALAVAAWLHFLRGVDEQGHPYPIDDPLGPALVALHERAWKESGARGVEQAARHFAAFEPVFGALSGQEALVSALIPPLQALRERGVCGALAEAAGC